MSLDVQLDEFTFITADDDTQAGSCPSRTDAADPVRPARTARPASHCPGHGQSGGSPTLETAGSRTVHLEGGDEVVIVVVEGAAERVSDHAAMEPMSEAYSSNYNWLICPRRDEVTDSDGNARQVFRVTPEVVFGWKMCEATRPQGQRLERG